MILLKRFCFGQPWSTRKNICRVTHANFMAKQVNKAVMKRFKFRNDFLKDRNMLPNVLTENNATYV